VLFAGVLVLGHPALAGASDAAAEANFVARINSIRRQHGVAPLAVYSQLTGISRQWTDHMVANGNLSHNGNLSNEVSGDWTKLGENIGMGTDVDSIMNQFVSSGAHYNNMVDPAFNYIGVGVSYDASGQMYTTHDFMAMGDGPAPPPLPSAPTPRAARAPSPPPAPEPEPEPEPVPVTPPVTPARMHTMLAALQVVADPPNPAAAPTAGPARAKSVS
jgi:hypothetical protein